MTIKKFSLILLVVFSIGSSEIILAEKKNKPPVVNIVVFTSAGAILGSALGVGQFRNPEYYIDLTPLVSTPACAILGAFLVQFGYKYFYNLSINLK